MRLVLDKLLTDWHNACPWWRPDRSVCGYWSVGDGVEPRLL